MEREKKNKIILDSVLLFIAIAPIFYFIQIEKVSYWAFLLGAGSWGIGSALKVVAHQLIVKRLQEKNTSLITTSFLNGLQSGFFELAAAFIVILLMKDKMDFDYNAIVCFGLGIGSYEILLVVFFKGKDIFHGTALEESSGKLSEYLDKLEGSRYYCFNLLLPIAERLMATTIHISTRGLVFITMITGNIFPIIIALSVFIIVDGFLAYYSHLSGKLITKKGYIQIHINLLVISILSSATFIVLMTPIKDVIY